MVFPNRAGNPIHPSSFNTAHWKPTKAQVRLDGLRFHDLRHTAVALAIVQGAHPKAIQARINHSSVQVTLDRYGHLFPELDADISDGLDRAFRALLLVLPGPLGYRRGHKGHKGHKNETKMGGVEGSTRQSGALRKVPLTWTFVLRRRGESNSCTGLCSHAL